MNDSLARTISNPARLAALRELALLDSPAEEGFDRLTHLAARVLGVPIALVSLVEEDRQFFKSSVGLAEPLATRREMLLSHSFCQHVVAWGQPFLVEDARTHPLVQNIPSVSEGGAIAYAGYPLVTPEGHTLGSLGVVDTRPRAWSVEEIDILRQLAASVMAEIELGVAIGAMERKKREAQERRRQEEAEAAALKQRAFLREVLFSATEGKLRLCGSENDLPAPLPEAASPVALSKPALKDLRQQVLGAAAERDFPPERRVDLITAAGEASMNAVVHGEQGAGRVCASENTVQVWISDKGKGIAFESLHRATLERGWTTAGSMGHGFWLMLRACDRVYLLTGQEGTTTVIEQDRENPGSLWLSSWN